MDLGVYLELHNLRELTNCQVIGNVEPEEKLANKTLIVDYLRTYRLYYDCEQRGVLELKVFILYFPLGCQNVK